MAYGTLLTDTIQASVASTVGTLGTPPQFNDANGVQTGTLCRAWVNFDGTNAFSPNPSTSAIRASFNVSSVTRNGTGKYTVNFTNAMPDVNYSVSGGASSSNCEAVIRFLLYSTTSVDVQIVDSNTPVFTDDSLISVSIFR